MYKKALNNQQWLMCHKTQPNQTKPKTFLAQEHEKQNCLVEKQTSYAENAFRNL